MESYIIFSVARKDYILSSPRPSLVPIPLNEPINKARKAQRKAPKTKGRRKRT